MRLSNGRKNSMKRKIENFYDNLTEYTFDCIPMKLWIIITAVLCIVFKAILDLSFVYLLEDKITFFISVYVGLMIGWLHYSKKITNVISMILIAVCSVYLINVYSTTLSVDVSIARMIPAIINVIVSFVLNKLLCEYMEDKYYVIIRVVEDNYEEEYKIKQVRKRFDSLKDVEEMFAEGAIDAYREFARIAKDVEADNCEKEKLNDYIKKYNTQIRMMARRGKQHAVIAYFYGAYIAGIIDCDKQKATTYIKEAYDTDSDDSTIDRIIELCKSETKNYEPSARHELLFQVYDLLNKIVYGGSKIYKDIDEEED